MKSAFKKFFIASTKDGYTLKSKLLPRLEKSNIEIVDIGVKNESDQADVVDIAIELVKAIKASENAAGIICTGFGSDAALVLNKFSGIRSSFCHDYYTAKMSREHNNANVLALAQDCTGTEVASEMVEIFLQHTFEDQPAPANHIRRVGKIADQEISTK